MRLRKAICRSWFSSSASSVNKVEAQEETATGYVEPCNWRDLFLTHDCVFVVEREACPAMHKGIVAIAEGEGVQVAQITRIAGQRLLRHADKFVAVDKNELRIDGVMRLDQCAVPLWRAGTRRQPVRIVGSCSCAQESILAAVHEERGDIELLDVPHADEASAVERFLAETIKLSCAPALRQVIRRRTAEIGKRSHALQAEAASLECLAGRQVGVITVAVGNTYVAVVTTQQGRGIASAVIFGMPHQFHAKLVVAQSENIGIADRHKVIELVQSAVTRQREDAFFR